MQQTNPTYSTLLQDLTQDSATLTGWRRTIGSGKWKMIAVYGPGIFLLGLAKVPAQNLQINSRAII
jgi:hypothetical protein